jgi:hypothetical protein
MEQILTHHQLKHLPRLRVGDNLLTTRFASGCAISNCSGTCCKYGVFADVEERNHILAHTDLVRSHLEPQQEQNPYEWFEHHEVIDGDFVSGKAVGTQAREYGCVFLDSNGRCALQKAAMASGMHPYALKPFYCVAFPITISEGELIVDDLELEQRVPCCAIENAGTLDVFDVCAVELEYVLGKEGFAELKGFAGKK